MIWSPYSCVRVGRRANVSNLPVEDRPDFRSYKAPPGPFRRRRSNRRSVSARLALGHHRRFRWTPFPNGFIISMSYDMTSPSPCTLCEASLIPCRTALVRIFVLGKSFVGTQSLIGRAPWKLPRYR